MLTRTLRNSMKRREGQALVMGAITVLILTIAVITTVNFGHTIHERVRLQNTADAAAYSMAAMEARAFNFYAFSNRTQVSHYVSAMVWQSMLSFAYFLEAFLVDVYGVMKSLDRCANPDPPFWTIVCPILENLPYVGPVIKAIDQLINTFRQFITNLYLNPLKATNPDKIVGKFIIPGYRVLNMGMSALSTATLFGTLTHVQGMSADVITDNDPNINLGPMSVGVGLLSSCILGRAHMKQAGVSIGQVPQPQNAIRVEAVKDTERDAIPKRAMGNIINATRFGCDTDSTLCGKGWVTNRKLSELFPIPDSFGVLKDLLSAAEDSPLNPIKKVGQTKMLTYQKAYVHGPGGNSMPSVDDQNYIRDWSDTPTAPIGQLAQGDNMGSDDLYSIKFGPAEFKILGFGVENPFSCADDQDPLKCWGDPRHGKGETNSNKLPYRHMTKTSIWALNSKEGPAGGIHFRLVRDLGGSLYPQGATFSQRPQGGFGNADKNIGISKVKRTLIDALVTSLDIDMYVANVRPVRDGNHTWDGIIRFPHFEPGMYSGPCAQAQGASEKDAANRSQEFNQPSSWVVLNKKPEELLNPKPDETGATRNGPAMLNTQKTLNFTFNAPTKLVLENSRKEFLTFKGLNSISRAQTYYHRPGNWTEQPNFFNPYWRPRLASVWQGRYSLPLVNDVANLLPGPIKQLPQKIITH